MVVVTQWVRLQRSAEGPVAILGSGFSSVVAIGYDVLFHVCHTSKRYNGGCHKALAGLGEYVAPALPYHSMIPCRT